ncbi:MAG TPA: acyl carrier protein [Myxococcota bacterium]|nr:acyl carrier protein [Myxococcota bacterium]
MEEISQEQIRKDLVEILSKLAGLDPDTIGSDDRLREDLGLDSLQSMELLSRISDRYELDLDVEDVMDVESVSDVVSRLHGFMQESRAG